MNQNFTLFLQAGRYATKWERALRATICFSIERVRPRDAADVYILKNVKRHLTSFARGTLIATLYLVATWLPCILRHWKTSTAGSRQCSNYKSKQMRESLSLFLNKFYLFKLNLFVHGPGRRLDQESKQSLAVFFSLPSVASCLEKPLLAGYQKWWTF